MEVIFFSISVTKPDPTQVGLQISLLPLLFGQKYSKLDFSCLSVKEQIDFNMYGTCLHLIFMLIFLESYNLNLLESLSSDSKDIGNTVTSPENRDGTYRW